MKKCRVCGEPSNRDRTICLPCDAEQSRERYDPEKKRNSDYKKLYGITLATYNTMLEAQGGVCDICGGVGTKNLAVDHDHVTGEVRGLLCDNCNRGIGHLQDDIEIVLSAAKYLNKHKD